MSIIDIKTIKDDVTERLQKMVEEVNLSSSYFARVLYPQYLEIQKKRWATNNSSQEFGGGEWAELKNEKDIAYKKKKYAHAPGGGEQLLVRNGSMYNSIVDPGDSNHQAIFGEHSMIINTTVKYALYVDAGTPKMVSRTFSQFSDSWKQQILEDFTSYIAGLQ